MKNFFYFFLFIFLISCNKEDSISSINESFKFNYFINDVKYVVSYVKETNNSIKIINNDDSKIVSNFIKDNENYSILIKGDDFYLFTNYNELEKTFGIENKVVSTEHYSKNYFRMYKNSYKLFWNYNNLYLDLPESYDEWYYNTNSPSTPLIDLNKVDFRTNGAGPIRSCGSDFYPCDLNDDITRIEARSCKVTLFKKTNYKGSSVTFDVTNYDYFQSFDLSNYYWSTGWFIFGDSGDFKNDVSSIKII